MRILFSATPAHGHVLPMMPLARAAMSAGHEVSLLTHGALSEWVEPVPVPVLAVGLTFDELRATFSDRAPAPRAMTTPEGAAEFFVDTRVTATLDPALSIAAAFRPDLLIVKPRTRSVSWWPDSSVCRGLCTRSEWRSPGTSLRRPRTR